MVLDARAGRRLLGCLRRDRQEARWSAHPDASRPQAGAGRAQSSVSAGGTGASQIVVLLVERLIRRFAPGASHWLRNSRRGRERDRDKLSSSEFSRQHWRLYSNRSSTRSSTCVALWIASRFERCAIYDLPGGWPRPPGTNTFLRKVEDVLTAPGKEA